MEPRRAATPITAGELDSLVEAAAREGLLEKNVQCVHAVRGTHIPQAPGAGYAFQQEGADRLSVASFGDGAASAGAACASGRAFTSFAASSM